MTARRCSSRRATALALVAILGASVLAAGSSAAAVGPRALVLQQSDVPARYFFDKDNSLAISIGATRRTRDESSAALRRAGFEGGYVARYRNTDPPRWRDVSSIAYVFRGSRGARSYLAWLTRSLEHQNGPKFQRSRVGIGSEGWVYTAITLDTGSLVVWRFGRLVAVVACQEMTRHRPLALALARKQQHRIAAALR